LSPVANSSESAAGAFSPFTEHFRCRRRAGYFVGIEDGPEAADSSYTFEDKTYRLEEDDSEVWSV